LSTIDFWLNLPDQRQFIYMADEATVRQAVRAHKPWGAAAMKVWYIMPPQPPDTARVSNLMRVAGDEARKVGLPLIVHATGLWEAKDALRAGARVLVHSVWSAPLDDEFLALARSQGTTYVPTLTVPDGYRQVAARRFARERQPLACVDPATRAKVLATDTVALVVRRGGVYPPYELEYLDPPPPGPPDHPTTRFRSYAHERPSDRRLRPWHPAPRSRAGSDRRPPRLHGRVRQGPARLGDQVPRDPVSRLAARVHAPPVGAPAPRRLALRQGQRRLDPRQVQELRARRTDRDVRRAVPHAQGARRGARRAHEVRRQAAGAPGPRRSDVEPAGGAASHLQRLLDRRRCHRPPRVRELRGAGGLRAARADGCVGEGRDRDRALLRVVARHQAQGRSGARRRGLHHLLRSPPRRPHAGRRVPAGSVAPQARC